LALLHTINGIVLFFYSGGVTVIILQQVTKRIFSFWEFACFSFLGSILFFPLLLLVEFLIVGYVYSWFPFINILFLAVFSGILFALKKTSLPAFPNFRKNLFAHPFILTSILLLVFIGIIVSAYDALPDLDPYRWLFRYTADFSLEQLSTAPRPLFESLTFIGVYLLGFTEVFPFFKFFLPFLFASILLPMWLIASTFPDRRRQQLFLLLSFTSPVILLYGTTAMPNAILMILSLYFVLFLLIDHIRKDSFFFYSAGAVIITAFLYHEAAAIAIIPWISMAILSNIRTLLSDKKVFILLILLLASNITRFSSASSFISNWIQIIRSRFSNGDTTNFYFPAFYRNVDQNLMGWSGADGVIKYYAFHMGPVIGCILAISLTFFLFRKSWRIHLMRNIKSKSMIVIIGVFSIYFIIAEIFPRYPNIALLPDRAWIFAGISSLAFAYLLLKYRRRRFSTWEYIITICIISVGIGGAIYINHLKTFLITPEQLRSAEWIKANLPKDRLFLSSGGKNLLPVHANSRLIRMPNDTYCDNLSKFNRILTKITPDPSAPTNQNEPLTFTEFLSSVEHEIKESRSAYQQAGSPRNQEFIRTQTLNDLDSIIHPSSPVSSSPGLPMVSLSSQISTQGNIPNYLITPTDAVYIYYSHINENNPYGNRPYTMTSWGFDGCPDNDPFVFDRYPDKFKRVYNDHEEVIIWKVL